MLKLIAQSLISAPAIWGKIPIQGDFIRHRTNGWQIEGWQHWIEQNISMAKAQQPCRPAHHLPIAFILRPKQLEFARTRYVIGVVSKSMDKIEREYPILIYQFARASWVRQHFLRYNQNPREWLFWLSRLIKQHTESPASLSSFSSFAKGVDELWQVHAPRWRSLIGLPELVDQKLSERLIPAPNEKSHLLQPKGVTLFPFHSWPQPILQGKVSQMFWQQDDEGGFVAASPNITELWPADSVRTSSIIAPVDHIS